tara:strand:- start:1564 stop:2856 length:1293 start_codon:yes stop_codon:yes gene_type:complete
MIHSDFCLENSNSEYDRKRLLHEFKRVRKQTISIIDGLTEEDMTVQSMDDASPTKWHLAHTTWFFETFILEKYKNNYKLFNKAFKQLFNSYYNQIGSQHPRPIRGLLTRPNLNQVMNYRSQIDNAISELITNADKQSNYLGLIELGINHEQQHQELIFTDILHLFSKNPLSPAWKQTKTFNDSDVNSNKWIHFPGNTYSIGHSGDSFGFDHEGPKHKVIIPDFKISNTLVTNGQWLEFIENSGYQRPEFWLSDGWDIKTNNGWTCPEYWCQNDNKWMHMTLCGMESIKPNAPVCHVSYYEADAFARWSGNRLPTEVEWEIASQNSHSSNNTLGSEFYKPLPAAYEDNTDIMTQMFGDVWEFTQSSFSPYPGFKAVNGAIGEYNGKFMSNQMVLRGASCVTPDNHSRKTYRNFFYPFQRWQFTGLRLASDL